MRYIYVHDTKIGTDAPEDLEMAKRLLREEGYTHATVYEGEGKLDSQELLTGEFVVVGQEGVQR